MQVVQATDCESRRLCSYPRAAAVVQMSVLVSQMPLSDATLERASANHMLVSQMPLSVLVLQPHAVSQLPSDGLSAKPPQNLVNERSHYKVN
jgi:hypothetical protein